MKKISGVIFILFLLLTFGINQLVNCQAAEKENIKKDAELSIGVSLSTLDKDSMLYIKNEFVKQCEKEKIKLQIKNSNNSCKIQKDYIKELVRSGINVLVVDAVDANSKSIKDGLNFAIANDVRVILLNSKVKGFEEKTSFVGFDDYNSGKAVAKNIVDYFEKNNKKESSEEKANKEDNENLEITAIVLSENNNSDSKIFVKGLKSYRAKTLKIKANYVLDSLEEINVSDAYEKAMEKYSKVDVVICTSDYIASICNKVFARDEVDVVYTGQDSDIAACSRVAHGKQLCTVYKPFESLVSETLRYSKNLYAGASFDTEKIKTTIVDGRNIMPVIVGNNLHQAKDIFAY